MGRMISHCMNGLANFKPLLNGSNFTITESAIQITRQ